MNAISLAFAKFAQVPVKNFAFCCFSCIGDRGDREVQRSGGGDGGEEESHPQRPRGALHTYIHTYTLCSQYNHIGRCWAYTHAHGQ